MRFPGNFAPGDRVSVTCDLCDVGVSVPLTGAYDDEVTQAAADRCVEWVKAHFTHFHPDIELFDILSLEEANA